MNRSEESAEVGGITDNWLEMTMRFVTHDHGTRAVKVRSAGLLERLDAGGIGIASSTSEIVGLPPLRIGRAGAPPPRQ